MWTPGHGARSGGKVRADELENSFNVYYDAKGAANKLRTPRAFHIMGTPNHDGGIFIRMASLT